MATLKGYFNQNSRINLYFNLRGEQKYAQLTLMIVVTQVT